MSLLPCILGGIIAALIADSPTEGLAGAIAFAVVIVLAEYLEERRILGLRSSRRNP